jgi:hypothetical protein
MVRLLLQLILVFATLHICRSRPDSKNHHRSVEHPSFWTRHRRRHQEQRRQQDGRRFGVLGDDYDDDYDIDAINQPTRIMTGRNSRRQQNSRSPNNMQYRNIKECRSGRWRWTEDFLHQEGYDADNEDEDMDEVEDTDEYPFLDERGGEHLPNNWAESSQSSTGRQNDPYQTSIQSSRGTLSRRNNRNRRDNRGDHRRKKHSPVVYQYFGRSRRLGPVSPDALHFILLGPNVDHWKSVGQLLASRGFNVMACERIEDDEKSLNNDSSKSSDNSEHNDAPELVLEVLGKFWRYRQ